jgi:16S rRNA (uracil1498-N3)-methyltransferase
MNIILFPALEAENVLSMTDERALHIKKVLRLKEGDSFQAGIINQGKGKATITRINEQEIAFTFAMDDKTGTKLYPVTLLVAQVRPICMRRILREAVSLGVRRIMLTQTETGEKSYAQANLYTSGEYQSILVDGAMQSGECAVSEVVFASCVREALTMLKSDSTKIVLDNVRPGVPLSTLSLSSQQGVVLAIGGERGFTEAERDRFQEAGFLFASLGSRILRTETACSAGLAVLLGRMGLL